MTATIAPVEETFHHKRTITKFALAGVAVFGIGASLTSAAWSDSVFFAAPAKAAAFELEGYDPINDTWVAADTAGVAIVLPADAIDAIGPGISDSYTVQVRNAGNIGIELQAPQQTTAGTLFGGTEPAIVSFGDYVEDGVVDGVLDAGEGATLEVIVTGPTTWTGVDYQGRSGTVTVQVQGQS